MPEVLLESIMLNYVFEEQGRSRILVPASSWTFGGNWTVAKKSFKDCKTAGSIAISIKVSYVFSGTARSLAYHAIKLWRESIDFGFC